ncbi:retrovirus-related pol polyprotein from transposon TNT 1-94 [Tanacetum coccineum]
MLLPKSDVPSNGSSKIPPQVNVLAWKISMDRLPTRVNLHRRGVQVSPISCPICCEALENLDHLLFCCDLAKDIARSYLMTNTQTPPTVVNTTGAPVTNAVANHAEKPEKFNGQNFKRWQQKMFFYLTTLGLARQDHDSQRIMGVIERNTRHKMRGIEKFVGSLVWITRGLIQRMRVSQVQDLQHKRKEMSVEDLVVCLRIEEDNKLAQKDTYTPDSAKANMVEHAGPSIKQAPNGESTQANMVNDDVGYDTMVSDSLLNISERLTMDRSCIWATSATADIKGEGDVILKMTSEKELKLTNVLYVLEIRKNLVVRSDRGGEYVAPFAELYAKHGIRHEFTAPYSPQQNGIAERKNRTLKEMVTAMLISSGMSQDMWGEAILTATYLLNKIPRKEKEETPYELWMGRKPSYQYLRVWGCLAKVAVHLQAQKMD